MIVLPKLTPNRLDNSQQTRRLISPQTNLNITHQKIYIALTIRFGTSRIGHWWCAQLYKMTCANVAEQPEFCSVSSGLENSERCNFIWFIVVYFPLSNSSTLCFNRGTKTNLKTEQHKSHRSYTWVKSTSYKQNYFRINHIIAWETLGETNM